MKQRKIGSTRLYLEELEGRLVLSPVFSTTSTNWSGYAVTTAANQVSKVSGSWVVPTATGNGYSSVWVGIDGYSSSTVEQIGTESDIINGKTEYYAWWEMYPNYSVEIPGTVKPGDTITASVTYSSTNHYTLTINDSSWSQAYTTTQTMTGGQRSSAEWIVEAPSSGYGILPLANFTSVTFTNAQAKVGSTTGAINAVGSTVESINMISPTTGATLDTTSALDSTGTSFSVTTPTTTTTTPAPTPRHHSWWWWETNQPGTTTSTSTVTISSTNNDLAVAQALLNNNGTQVNSNVFSSTQAAAGTALAAPVTLSTSFNPATVTSASHFTQESEHLFIGGTDQTGTDLNNPMAVPGDQFLPEPTPDLTPAPMPMLKPGAGDFDSQAANMVWQPGSDVITNGRWDPATLQAISTPTSTAQNDGTTLLVDSAGVMLTLTLSGSWTILSAEAAEYRRRRLVIR